MNWSVEQEYISAGCLCSCAYFSWNVARASPSRSRIHTLSWIRLLSPTSAHYPGFNSTSPTPYLVHYVCNRVVICDRSSDRRSQKRLAPSRLFCFVILGVNFAWSTPLEWDMSSALPRLCLYSVGILTGGKGPICSAYGSRRKGASRRNYFIMSKARI